MAFTFDAAIAAITALQPSGGAIEPCTQNDAELLQLQTGVAEATKRLHAISALLAAEIAHRSRRELGHDGLAYRAGFRTPEKLIQQATGTTGADARKLVRVGTQVAQTLAADILEESSGDGGADSTRTNAPPEVWHAELDRAVADGLVSVDAADGIRRGLGEPGEGAPEESMRNAVGRLIQYASRAHADDVWARARNERDLLDPNGVADLEKQRRDARYLKLFPQPDGMTRLTGLLDPESAQIVCTAFDAVVSPRRGGPRFTRKADRDRAQRLLEDSRSTEQIMADTLVDIITLATRKDTGRLFGTTRPTVRLIATMHTATSRDAQRAASTGDAFRKGGGEPANGPEQQHEAEPQHGTAGFGVLLGQIDPVSAETVQRHLCNGHHQIVHDENGHTLNYGRAKRTFSTHQRDVLNARDGGCMWPDCDRPPDWCEAHHIDEWSAHHGKTDIDDGILLCRSCHLRLHNDHWRIDRRPDRRTGHHAYWLRPPGGTDSRDDILLHRKNPLLDAVHTAS
ncbi:HNH endonuclease signature motif containing protein [Humibacter antri]